MNWHDNWDDLATLCMPKKLRHSSIFLYAYDVENLCVSLGSLEFAHVPTRPCSSIMYICDDIACIVRIVSGKIIISREHFYCFHFVSFGHHRSFQHFNSRITLKTFNLPNKKRKRKKRSESYQKCIRALQLWTIWLMDSTEYVIEIASMGNIYTSCRILYIWAPPEEPAVHEFAFMELWNWLVIFAPYRSAWIC